MQGHERARTLYNWLLDRPVEVAFSLVAAGWVGYVLRITREFSFWSDDLLVIDRAGSWGDLLQPYNGALSLVSLLINRAAVEAGDFSYTPFLIAGALSLAAVPVSYFFTTKRRFGPPLAAILALPLLWYDGMNLRPAGLNHYLALVGGIFCAAMLNRGRRGDGVLAVALAFSLASAGGGVVVAGACLLHNLMVRPPWRRWLAVVGPTALYGLWYLIAEPSDVTHETLSAGETARTVGELSFEPFSQVAFGVKPLAGLLMIAFFVWGFMQLRRGLVAGANFVAWTAAMIGWALALVQSRGSQADPEIFRYAYLSLGFALLAVVPRDAIRWPSPLAPTNRRWIAAAAVMVLALGGARFLDTRQTLQAFASQHAQMGRLANGTITVVGLGSDVIPDSTPIVFFGIGHPHGSAGRLRALLHRYGSPFDATSATADQELANLYVIRSRLGLPNQHPGCRPLTGTVRVAATTFREGDLGIPVGGYATLAGRPLQHQLWSSRSFTVDVRRFGDRWVRLATVPAGRDAFLSLPTLNAKGSWEIRAAGACLIPTPTQPG